jgi:hypothetical protein
LWPCFQRSAIDEIDRAEPARVIQRQCAPCPGLDHQMIVLADFIGIDSPAPAHAEVKHHGLPAIAVDESVFGAAAEPGYPRTGQRLHQLRRKRAAQVRAAGLDTGDHLPIENMGKAAHGGFDFGQFGHRALPLTGFAVAAIPT